LDSLNKILVLDKLSELSTDSILGSPLFDDRLIGYDDSDTAILERVSIYKALSDVG